MSTDSMSERLQALEDERAILETLYQYGHAMDYGPDADFVDCFTPDGLWDVRMRKLPDGSFETDRVSVGRDGLTPPM